MYRIGHWDGKITRLFAVSRANGQGRKGFVFSKTRIRWCSSFLHKDAQSCIKLLQLKSQIHARVTSDLIVGYRAAVSRQELLAIQMLDISFSCHDHFSAISFEPSPGSHIETFVSAVANML